jgi:hypothetical protein
VDIPDLVTSMMGDWPTTRTDSLMGEGVKTVSMVVVLPMDTTIFSRSWIWNPDRENRTL